MNESAAVRAIRRIRARIGSFGCGVLLLVLLSGVAGCRTADPSLALVQAAAAQATNQVIINAGDLLSISFPTSSQNNISQRVRLDGRLQMPLIGELVAAGKTPLQLQADLKKLYEKELQVGEVVVVLASTTASIFVAGAVGHAGRISLERPMTLLDAIMEAGGVDARRSNVRKITVIRQENGRYTRQIFNLKPVLSGKNVQPFWVKPFDIIFVPEKLF